MPHWSYKNEIGPKSEKPFNELHHNNRLTREENPHNSVSGEKNRVKENSINILLDR